jgi:hypothetical protein
MTLDLEALKKLEKDKMSQTGSDNSKEIWREGDY